MTNNEMKDLAKACIILDKLQVELSEDTPYPTPTTKEIRDRILKAMDYLEKFEVKEEPSAMWQSICDGLAQEKGVHKTRISILKNLDTVQNEVIPDLLESEVAEFKGNTANSNNPIKYLTDCIMGWITAAVRNPDMVY